MGRVTPFSKMSQICLSRKYVIILYIKMHFLEFQIFPIQFSFCKSTSKMDSNPINIDINCSNSSEILPFEPSSRVTPFSKNVSNMSVQKICHYFVHKNAFSRVSEFSYTVFLFPIHFKNGLESNKY